MQTPRHPGMVVYMWLWKIV